MRFALGALLEWPRRVSAAALLLLALAASAARPLERLANPGRAWAVVSTEVALPGTDVSLDPGQVVRVLGEEGSNVRVRAARDLEGVVPDSALRRARGARH